ncbi:MAG TPA: hypothetical protein VIS07_17380 [Candidatus Binatia bacterium]
MQTFNTITSAIFDVILAPFGHRFAWFDLLVWPVVAGVVALLVYKLVSNQAGIAAAKKRIVVHLLEVVLYRDDVLSVIRSTARGLGQNLRYLGYNVVPLLVMIVPMTIILVQLVAHYAYAPLERGDVQLLEVELVPGANVGVRDVTAEFPPGVAVQAGPVRTADGRVYWRLEMLEDGDHVIVLRAGDEVQEKVVAVGNGPRKVPVLRTRTWEALLYPGEAALPAGSAFETIRLATPTRDLSPLPSGEGGILLWFFAASLIAGFLLRKRLGVTL